MVIQDATAQRAFMTTTKHKASVTHVLNVAQYVKLLIIVLAARMSKQKDQRANFVMTAITFTVPFAPVRL
jgi:hypothetical protein